MTISVATKNQLPIIQELTYKIWPITYGEILSNEQLEYMLNKFYDILYLENQLDNGQVFLLAEENGIYYGFASYELNCDNSNKTKIHKLYVLPQTQGKGLGKLFVDKITKIAKEANNKSVFLNVNRYNKALMFYEKIGFQNVKTIDIEIGNGYLMEDFVMELSF
ncbi:GNAT family N-acetyltransferase [Flavobacterium sp. SUN052]|uniref:GNAT family N-acetyltransferase n=1 Tax=Flavobacterium sp. SUN052 TaxID=3002441 RepID=UPI00237D7A64|nr:GNAT family N-acetyltransferase [Flavobacterium sp. SUN052]MEC4005322.1 GNAT family N-acetyltransferase [Flavobacterium sp. SUN052]